MVAGRADFVERAIGIGPYGIAPDHEGLCVGLPQGIVDVRRVAAETPSLNSRVLAVVSTKFCTASA